MENKRLLSLLILAILTRVVIQLGTIEPMLNSGFLVMLMATFHSIQK